MGRSHQLARRYNVHGSTVTPGHEHLENAYVEEELGSLRNPVGGNREYAETHSLKELSHTSQRDHSPFGNPSCARRKDDMGEIVSATEDRSLHSAFGQGIKFAGEIEDQWGDGSESWNQAGETRFVDDQRIGLDDLQNRGESLVR